MTTTGTSGVASGTSSEAISTAEDSNASAGDVSAAVNVDGNEPLWKRKPAFLLAVGLVITVILLAIVGFFILSAEEDEVTIRPFTSDGSKLKIAPSTIPKNFMVCTVNGEGPSLAKLAAPTTICDIIFFDSILKEVGQEVEATFNDSLDTFLTWPSDYKSGEFGFSFTVETGLLRATIESHELEKQINALYTHGFRHSAVINIPSEPATDDDFKVALHALRTAFKVVSEKESNPAIYSVFGAAIKDASTLQKLLDEMKKVFVPSMFISITHVSHEDRALQDCRIVPPTWLSDPHGAISYGLSLTSGCQLLQEVAKANVNISLAVSFTLSGHMYKPQGNKPEDFKLYSPCEDFDGNYYVPPYEFCKRNGDFFKNIERSDHHMFTFSPSEQRALTFESRETIKNKVCEARSTCQGVTFGVAAYDIEYDYQPDSQCLEFDLVVRFGRVAFLKAMNKYLTSLTSGAAFKEEDCLRVEVL